MKTCSLSSTPGIPRILVTAFLFTAIPVAFSAPPVAADSRLVVRTETRVFSGDFLEDTRTTTRKHWLGDERINFDLGSKGLIIRFDQGQMFWIDHPRKAYEVFELPLEVRQHLSQEERRSLDELLTRASPAIEITKTDQVKATESWGPAELTRIEVSLPAMKTEIELDVWLSESVPIDIDLYYRGSVFRRAANIAMNTWASQLEELGGYPVEQVLVEKSGSRKVVVSYLLQSVEQVKYREGLYLPPPGYEEIPADYTQFAPVSEPSAQEPPGE